MMNVEMMRYCVLSKFFLLFCLLLLTPLAHAAPFLISISNPPPAVNITTNGGQQFWPDAGTLNGVTPISLRATVVNISPGDSVRLFTSGDNPVVRANTGTFSAEILWEVFDSNTGLPISGDPAFLITDIDGRNGNPIESVSAQCAGLTSYTVNGAFVPGVNANNNGGAQSNIRVTEVDGSILAEGTQGQNGSQQEGYMQYNWTGVESWVVNYFATTGGRWFVHDADGDIPFDGTEIDINLVDLATIKNLTSPPAIPGGTVSYEIILSNAGPADATNANITDVLPTGLTVVQAQTTATSGTVAFNGQSVIWTGVNLPAPVGGTPIEETLTITATVDNNVAPGTTLTNVTNTAEADQSKCSSRDQLSSSFIVSEPPEPSLSVVKSVAASTNIDGAGDTITYEYVITNTGNVEINDVVPTDNGPTFGVANGVNTLSAFTPTERDNLLPGQSQTFTATYLIDQQDVDNLANAADVTTGIDNSASAAGTPEGGVLPTPPSSTAETGFAITPSMTVAKTVSGATVFSQVGDIITYQYVVENTGNVTIESVLPTDAGPTFNGLAGTNSLGAFTPTTPATTLPVSLAPTESQTFTATYQLSQIDVDNMAAAPNPLNAIDNTASATGDPVGPAVLPTVPDSTVETGFAPAPSMTINKTVIGTVPDSVGDTITYQYVVENTGNVTVNNVTPTDTGPTFNGVPGTNALSGFSPSNPSIVPGASQTFTATYVISQQDVDNLAQSATPATAIDNTASATGTPTGGVLPAVPNSVAETGFVVNASLALVKTASAPTTGLGALPSATDAGDTIAYSFAVTNDGDVTIDQLEINDTGLTFGGLNASNALPAASCGVTVLLPGQSTTCTSTYTLAQTDIDNAVTENAGIDSIDNSATAAGEDPSNNPITSPPSNAETSISADSEIAITKTAAAPTIDQGDPVITDPGDTISYTILLENSGNTTLNSVTITDPVVTNAPNSGTIDCPATTVLGNAFANDGSDSLSAGDSISCTAEYTITQPDINGGQVVNTANVTAEDPTGAVLNESDSATTGFTQKASIELLKQADDSNLSTPPLAGESIVYSFSLENTGNVSLSDPQIADLQCPITPLTFTNGYLSGDTSGDEVLDAGEIWLFTCTVVLQAGDINDGGVQNTAIGEGTPPVGSGLDSPMSTAGTQTALAQETGIALDKVAGIPTTVNGNLSDVVDIGDTISYQFTIENTGNVTLTNVSLTDQLLGGAVTCPVSVLSAGVSVICTATYDITQININDGMVNNTAEVTGTPPSTVPPAPAPSAMSSAMVAIDRTPSLSVEKTVDSFDASTNTVTYSYDITNNGNTSITDVSPVDPGPTFNGIAGTSNTSLPLVFTPASADIEPNITTSFSASYVLTQTDFDNMAAAADPTTAIDNTATATGTPPTGTTLAAVPPSTAETGIAVNPELKLLKTSTPPASVTVGQAITYNFSLENTGDVTITNPTITDLQCELPGTVLSRSSGYVSGDAGLANQLDVNETWLFSCTYSITQDDIDAGTVQNTATATGQDPAGNDVSDVSDDDDNTGTDSDPTNTPLAADPSWSLAKSTASTPMQAGDTLIYSFVLTNTGNVSISGVNLNDPKCAAAPVLVGGDVDNNDLLAPTEVWTYNCTSIAVTQTEVDDGTVNNMATAAGSPPSGNLPNADSPLVQTPIAPNPVLSLTKTAGTPTTGLGTNTAATDEDDTIAYSFELSNDGNVTINNIAITDAGPSFNNVTGTEPLSSINCPLTTLNPGQSTTCIATYTLSQTDVDNAIAGGADTVENTATANGQAPNGAVASPDSTAVTTIADSSEIELVKIAGTPTIINGADDTLVDENDTISYSLITTNLGNTTLTNVTVTDDIASVSCPSNTNNGAPFANGNGALEVGDSVTCTASYSITQTNLNLGQVINNAAVVAQDPSGGDVNGVADATVSFTQKTSIELIKQADASGLSTPPLPGETIVYSFLLENTGNVSLSDAEVDDAQCPVTPLTFTNGYLSGDTDNDEVLDANETWEFSCIVVLQAGDINDGGVQNTATGQGTPPTDSGLDNPMSTAGTQTVLEQETGIALDKVAGLPTMSLGTLPNATDVGDTVLFTFTVENTGNVTLTNITVTDPLITGSINCVDASLDPGETTTCTATYNITQTNVDEGLVANMASVTGTPPVTVPPAPPPSAMSGATVPIQPVAQLEIEKTASAIGSDVVAGDIITYTFVVSNTGSVSIDNVEPIDAGPTFNGSAGSNVLGAYVRTSPPPPAPIPPSTMPAPVLLAPGESQTFTAEYVLSQDDLDNIGAAADSTTAAQNSATTTGEPLNGILLPVTPSTTETGVATTPEIELRKSSTPPALIEAGQSVTYNFELENTGNVTITNPTVNDAMCQLPGNALTFASGYVSDNGNADNELDVDEIWEFSCTYVLTQDDIDAGTVQNTAEAVGQDPAGTNVRDTSDSTNGNDTGAGDDDPTNTLLPRMPAWSVVKSTDSTPTQAGDTLLYMFEVTNDGNVSISNIAVNDAKCASAPALIGGDTDGNNILAPTEIFTYSCISIPVTQTEVDDGSVDNEVTVVGTPPLGSPPLNDAMDDIETAIPSQSSLALVKTAAAPTTGFGALSTATDAGDTITYTFEVTNDGNVTIDNLTIDDDAPTFNGTTGGTAGGIGVITCAATTLIPQQSTTCTGVYTLTQTDVDNGIAGGADSVSNTARANAESPGVDPISPDSTATTTIDSMPAVEVIKTLDANVTPNPSTAIGQADITDIGDTISYQLVVTNTGNAPLSSVLVTDSIATVDCPIDAFETGTGILAAGDSITCTAVYTLNQNDLDTSIVTNVGGVNGQDAQGTPVSDDDELMTTLTQKTSIEVIKTAVENFAGAVPATGDTIDYTFTLRNTGNVTLSNPMLSDELCPTPVLTVPDSESNLPANGIMEAGEIWTFSCTYAIDLDDANAGFVVNTATGTGTPPASSGLDNPSGTSGTETQLDQQTGIALDKVGAAPTIVAGTIADAADAGGTPDTISYVFNVTNTGNVTLTDVIVTDDQVVDVNCGAGNGVGVTILAADINNPGQETITCTATYSIEQDDIDTGSVVNVASVTGTPPATVPPAPNPMAESGATVPIQPAPRLSVDKSVTLPATLAAGQPITYTFVVSNDGNVTIENVLPIDAGPSFNGVAGESPLGAFTPTTPSTALPITLAPSESQTFEAEYVLTQGDIDNMAASATPLAAITNSATATGDPLNGNLEPVTPDTEVTGFDPDPSLILVKTAVPPTTVAAGALITYNFTLNNNGNVTVSNPIVTDQMCQTPGNPLSFNSGFTGGDTGGTNTNIAQSLDVGEIWTFQCAYAITQTDIDTGSVTNTAVGSGQDPAGDGVDDTSGSPTANPEDENDDPTVTTLAQNPAWEVEKTTPTVPTAAGQTLEYSFRVVNTGNTTISNITIFDDKCDDDEPDLLVNTDIGADNLLSPMGNGGSPAAEAWTYTCTSIPVTQDEMNQGFVLNNVTVMSPDIPDDATDSLSTDVVQTPELSLMKSAGIATLNSDGTFDQVFDFVLQNVGNVTVNDVSINDNIPAQLGACYDSNVSTGAVAFVDNIPAGDSLGLSTGALPVIAQATQLGVGDQVTVTGFTARFNPNAAGCTFPDPAQNTATATSTEATDVSDNGTDPTQGGANDTGVPTPFTPPTTNPELGLAKEAAILSFNNDFSFDVEFGVLMQNTGDQDLTNLSLFDDMVQQFGAAFTASASSNPTLGVLTTPEVTLVTDAGTQDVVLPTIDASFDGGAGNIFDGASGFLGVGDVIRVVFSVRINPLLLPEVPETFENTANGGADDPSGTGIVDQSNSGTDPTNGSGGPGEPTIISLQDVAALPIVLGQFSSELTGDNLLVKWQTQTEVSNLGFNLYGRADDGWILLTPQIIAGQGDSVEVVDYEVTVSSSIEALAISDIDVQGEETVHGPFVVGKSYGVESQRKFTDWNKSADQRKRKKDARMEKRREQMRQRNLRRKQLQGSLRTDDLNQEGLAFVLQPLQLEGGDYAAL